jgi:hypothetical protein
VEGPEPVLERRARLRVEDIHPSSVETRTGPDLVRPT